MLPGASAEQSVNNLYRWLDDVAIQLSLGHSFAVAFNGTRIPGVYYHLSRTEEQNLRQHMGHICHQWHIDLEIFADATILIRT